MNLKSFANNIKSKTVDYLSNKEDYDNTTVAGATLFASASSNTLFPEIYLFKNFGNCTGNAMQYTSEITNNYTEENFAVNDHWAINPIRYTLSGIIGEVVYTPATNWKNSDGVQNIIDYIKPLTLFSPTLDNYTQSALNIVQGVENSLLRYRKIARQAYQSFTNTYGNTYSNQSQIEQELKNLMLERTLVTIATPYETLSDMAIVSVNMRQDANTRFLSTLEVTLQQWRDVKTNTREATKKEVETWVNLQKSIEANNGNASTKQLSNAEKESTLRYGIRHGISPLLGIRY